MQFIKNVSAFTLLATFISACSGGGGGASPGAVPASASPGVATGTLVIGTPATASQARSRPHSRRPEYVSSATTYATLWIDNMTPGTRVACAPGSGKTCTINWTSTAGTHTFTAAIDDSSSISGGGNVLAAASVSETLMVGSNTLATISLNGVPAAYTYLNEQDQGAGGCSTNFNCIIGYFQVTDADGQLIDGPGGFYGCPTASPSTIGTWGCTSISTSNLSASINANGEAEFVAECNNPDPDNGGTSGNYSVALPAGGTTYVLTTQEIGEYSLVYPSKITATSAFPSYTCTNGNITANGAANGTVTLN